MSTRTVEISDVDVALVVSILRAALGTDNAEVHAAATSLLKALTSQASGAE